jgi:hypothetical protein
MNTLVIKIFLTGWLKRAFQKVALESFLAVIPQYKAAKVDKIGYR